MDAVLKHLSDKRRAQVEGVLAMLDRSLKAGEIRNTEYNEAKYYLTAALEDVKSKSACYPINLYIHSVASLLKKHERAKDQYDRLCPVMKAALEAMLPVSEKMATLKTMIVKGRKPSAEPNLNARTLENTGTCPICLSNVKLTKNGKLVTHGYQRPGHGYLVGECFGVSCKPYEISPEGCQAYIPVLGDVASRNTETVKKYQAGEMKSVTIRWGFNNTKEVTPETDAAQFARVVESRITELRQQNGLIAQEIKVMQARVADWKLAPLPGETK